MNPFNRNAALWIVIVLLLALLYSVFQGGTTRDDIAAASRATIPVGRYGNPEEFADAVAFLASARAAYITGTTLRVDGGMIRSI